MDEDIHIEQFISRFIAMPQRRRYLSLFRGNQPQRAKAINVLGDPPAFVEKNVEYLREKVKGKSHEQLAEFVLDLLSTAGAPDTAVYWGDRNCDPTSMPLKDAIDIAVRSKLDTHRAFDSSLVSCIPGKLVFVQGEFSDDCWLCRSR